MAKRKVLDDGSRSPGASAMESAGVMERGMRAEIPFRESDEVVTTTAPGRYNVWGRRVHLNLPFYLPMPGGRR